MLYNQKDCITEQLEHVLEKASAYRWQIARENNGVRTEMTSALHEIFWKMMNLQCNTSAMWNEDN